MVDVVSAVRDFPPVLEVENLGVAYKVRDGEIEAVQDVSFDIGRGESYGIVLDVGL